MNMMMTTTSGMICIIDFKSPPPLFGLRYSRPGTRHGDSCTVLESVSTVPEPAGKMPANPPPLLLVKYRTFLCRRRGLMTARKADPPKREERWRTRTPWAPPTACTTVSRAGKSTRHGHNPRNVRQPAEERIGDPSPPPTSSPTHPLLPPHQSLPRRPIITQKQRERPQHAPGAMMTEQRLLA